MQIEEVELKEDAIRAEIAAYCKANSSLSKEQLIFQAICEEGLTCKELRNRSIKSAFIQLMKKGGMTFTDIYWQLSEVHGISKRMVQRIIAK